MKRRVLLASTAVLVACTGDGSVLGETLFVRLDWTTASNLDLGATTPGGIVAANYAEADADSLCQHAGDDEGTGPGGSESFTCKPRAGTYKIVIDNYSGPTAPFTLYVKMDNENVTGPVNGSLTSGGQHSEPVTF